MAKKTFFIKESELDEYQRVVINKKSDNSLVIKGCAGSGKSIIALWKAKEIQANGHSYIYIVYTKALKQYMYDGISQIGINENNVDTYGRCFNWSKDENDKWIQGSWKKGHFDYIIVDEAQDFSLNALKILKANSNKILLYGDSAQTLYSEFSFDKNPTVDMETIKSFFKIPLESLVFNHRLPKKIARIAEYLNDEGDDLEVRCKNEGSETPRIIRYNSFDEQLDAIDRVIKNRKFQDVGILFKKVDEVKKASVFFKNKGLNVEAKINDKIDLNFNSDNPKLMPYQSSKGLQFEVVFLPECSCSGDNEKNSLYVALTRSYQSLYVMYSDKITPFFDLVSPDLYKTTEFDIIEDI